MPNNLAELEKWLICPVCRARVRLVDRKFWCTNPDCRRSYPIGEGDIPVMLEEHATVEQTAAEPFPTEDEGRTTEDRSHRRGAEDTEETQRRNG